MSGSWTFQRDSSGGTLWVEDMDRKGYMTFQVWGALAIVLGIQHTLKRFAEAGMAMNDFTAMLAKGEQIEIMNMWNDIELQATDEEICAAIEWYQTYQSTIVERHPESIANLAAKLNYGKPPFQVRGAVS